MLSPNYDWDNDVNYLIISFTDLISLKYELASPEYDIFPFS